MGSLAAVVALVGAGFAGGLLFERRRWGGTRHLKEQVANRDYVQRLRALDVIGRGMGGTS